LHLSLEKTFCGALQPEGEGALAYKLEAAPRLTRRTTGTTTGTKPESAEERRTPATQVRDRRREKKSGRPGSNRRRPAWEADRRGSV